MMRDELIAVLESGDSGDLVNKGVVALANRGFRFYTTSIDAAASLADGRRWTVTCDGLATTADDHDEMHVGDVPGNPAAALVVAWLRATAKCRG